MTTVEMSGFFWKS